MNSESTSEEEEDDDDESTSRISASEGNMNGIITHTKQPPPKRTVDQKKQNAKLFETLKYSNDDDENDSDDVDNDHEYDESDHSVKDDDMNDDHPSSDEDDDSRSEFDDDNEDDNEDDRSDHEGKEKGNRSNNDKLLHLPLNERLRHIQMEQGINQSFKEQRKRKYEQSQTVKEQILQKKQERSNGAIIDDTKQSDKTKKKSKHAPTVMSSKRSDFYHRQRLDIQGGGISAIGTNVQAHANVYKGRDPRSMMDGAINDPKSNNNSKRGGKKLLETIKGTSNNMNDYQYEDYAFIQEMRNVEIQKLQKRIKARQVTGRKGQEQRRRYNIQNDDDGLMDDQRELHRLQQEKANFERKQLDIATKRSVQQKLRESNVQRQRNHTNEADIETIHQNNDDDTAYQNHASSVSKYVPKVRELKRMYMETKYDLLSQQQKGKNTIDKMILKKHIKNKSKDSKKHRI